MRNPHNIGLLSLLTLMSIVAGAARADDAATRKILEQQYAKIASAYKSKNVKPALEASTPEFVQKLPSGQTVTRQQLETLFNQQMSFVKAVPESSAKIEKLTVKGNIATADIQQNLTMIVNDFQTQGMTHNIGSVTHSRDTWVKTGNTWLRKQSELLKGTSNIDGKTADMATQLNSLTKAAKGGMAPTAKTPPKK